MKWFALVAVTACAASGAQRGQLVTLRQACSDGAWWDGRACKPAGDARAKLAAGRQALVEFKVDDARAALDAAEASGPLDHEANVTLWEQRGIAAAYVEDEVAAAAAFDMLLALDPSHFLSYKLSPKATFLFEKVRDATRARGVPELDVTWGRGGRVGEPVPIDVEVLADPKHFLKRATVFVRTRGESSWRGADLALAVGTVRRLLLPPVRADKSVSLELYLRAYDDRGNEVLAWADPARPREIPLRYDPPQPWWRKWWVLAIAGSVVAVGTGVTVYELTIAPPDKVGGGVSVK